jgi:hypothetical protein
VAKSPSKKEPRPGGLPDADELGARVEAILADPLYWFPVRHHSPTVARFVREALLARRPKLLLMEGPTQASDLVKFVTDSKTKPPIAIFSIYRDDANTLGLAGLASPAADIPPRFSAWYPLLPYSPEYVALRTAREIGAEVIFIDLPHHALLEKRKAELTEKPVEKGDEEGEEKAGEEESEEKESETPEHEGTPPGWEHFVLESNFYKALAEAAGFRTWEEAWDSLFECGERHPDFESFRRDMAIFCGGVRATTPVARMEADGTLARERFMMKSIREALAARKLGPEKAFVLTGGFHLFLDRDDAMAPPEPPAGTVYTTIAPYSYVRVSELTGYGAGNRAPRYYQVLWDAYEKRLPDEPPPVSAMVDHVVSVLTRGRKEEGEGLSSADAISVTQHARMLASLRGRKHPVLDDIRDAIVTCCVKGNPADEGAHVLRAMSAVETGNAVGRVTPELGQLPLVHDFYAQVDALELDDLFSKEKRLALTLDRREPLGERRSVFLHRIVHLGVPLGALDAPTGASVGTLFRESWRLKWSPKVEEALIEKSLHGDSVEAAATALLEEELAKDEQHAGRTCERLVKSIAMDLPGMVQRLEAVCGSAIDEDRRFGSLAQALTNLLVLDRHAAYRKLSRLSTGDLVVRCYGRACFAVQDAASVPEEEQAEVIAGLQALAEATLGEYAEKLDRALFAENVKSAAASSTVPFLKGALLGLLTEIRAQTSEELAAHVSAFARALPETLVQAGAFLDGIFAVSKTSLLIGADALIGAIDELLRAAAAEAFLTMLPRVRHAFDRLHERQRLSLCDRVAERYGLKDGEKIAKLETSVAAAAHLASIDARVAEIMKDWTF